MKKKLIMAACFAIALAFGGCRAETTPASEPEESIVQTEALSLPTEQTAPAESESVNELIMSESYYFSSQDSDAFYQRYLTLYPNSCFYDARWDGDNSWGTYLLDGEGRLVMDIAGGTLCLQ